MSMSNAFASAAADDSDDDATKSLPSNASSLLRQRGRQHEQMNDPAKTLRKNVKFNSFTTATDGEDGDLPPTTTTTATENNNTNNNNKKEDKDAFVLLLSVSITALVAACYFLEK